MAFEFIGPAKVLIGDPTTALGADMTNLGDVEDVAFDPGVRMAFTSSAALAGAPKASGIYQLAPLPVVQMQLKDGALAIAQEILLAGVVTGTAIGGGDDFKLIAQANVPVLVIVPYLQKASGASAANAIWIPAAVPDQINGMTFNRPQAGEIGNPYNVQVMGAYRSTDHDAVAIPAGNRLWFMGPPSNLSLTWSLPTL